MMMKQICALSMLALLTMLAIPRAADANNFRVEIFNDSGKCVWMTVDAGLLKRVNIRYGAVKPREHIAFTAPNDNRIQLRAQFWSTAACSGGFIQDRYDNVPSNTISHWVLAPQGNTFAMHHVGR